MKDPTCSNEELKDSTCCEEGKESENSKKLKNVIIKVGLIGESHTGKTNLMVKHGENRFSAEDIETSRPFFFFKTIKLKKITVTLSLWKLGQNERRQEWPLLCNDAKIFLFVFDLTRKQTLSMIREWFKRARKQNKYAIPFLIGSKFDLFDKKAMNFKEEITKQARRYAKKMNAPLIFCSSFWSINIKSIIKLIIARVFQLTPNIAEITKVGEPIVEYKVNWTRRPKNKDKTKISLGRRRRKDGGEEKKHLE